VAHDELSVGYSAPSCMAFIDNGGTMLLFGVRNSTSPGFHGRQRWRRFRPNDNTRSMQDRAASSRFH